MTDPSMPNMGPAPVRVCEGCGEELTPNSAVYDDYGVKRWNCTNPDCPETSANSDSEGDS